MRMFVTVAVALAGAQASAQAVERVCAISGTAMQEGALGSSALISMLTSYSAASQMAAEESGPDALAAQQEVLETFAPRMASTIEALVQSQQEHMAELASLCGWDYPKAQ